MESSFTYLPQSSNYSSNLPSSFTPPPTLPSPPFSCTPGTDPQAHQGQLVAPRVEREAQEQFDENRSGDSQSCDVTLPATGLNSSGNNIGLNQSLVNNVISTPKQTGMIQLMQCEVCNIQCQAIDFEKHIVGKKHRRNLQVKSNSTLAAFREPSDGANAQELERKKQQLLNSGVAVNSIQVCTICNVACNSHENLAQHLSGRKHAAQVGQIAVDGIGPDLAAFRAKHHFCNEGKKTTDIPQSSWCQVCQIDVYVKHLSGKKHLKNVENLEKSKNGTLDPSVGTPVATSLMIKSVENPAASGDCIINVKYWEKMAAQSKASKEDLNKSNWEVMEGGAAAAVANNSYGVNVQNPDKMAAQSEASKEGLEMKKQKVMESGAVAAAVSNSGYGDNVRNPEKMEALSGASEEDLEMKKQKVMESGAVSASVANSGYGDNVRNPEKMEALSGASKEDSTRKRKVMEARVAAAVVANSSYGIDVQNPEKLAEQSGAPKKDLETKGHKTMEGGAAAASVANGSLSVGVQNSEKMVAQYGASKEYLETKKQKVMEGVTAAEANSSYGVVQNPEQMVPQSQASNENLETKRRKLIESGTPAADIMSCTFCNVVCNSQTVFKYHLAGHKHAAMVKKQASAGIPTGHCSNENQRMIT